MENILKLGKVTIFKDTLKRIPDTCRYLYEAQCDCGKILFIDKGRVDHGKVKSCRNCYQSRDPRELKIGQRFGRLTLTGHSFKSKHSQDFYTCICDCGKSIKVTKFHLLEGLTNGCGKGCPILIEPTELKPGQVFGYWTVLTEKISGRAGLHSKLFECRCACGTIKYHTAHSLRTENSTACRNCIVKYPDLKPGEIFGWWTVLGGKKFGPTGEKLFEIQCKCGYIRYHSPNILRKNRSSQCWDCYVKSRSRKKATNGFIPFI